MENNTKLTPRQWALYRLIEHNSKVEHRRTTQREIYDSLQSYGYEWTDNPKSHDHCAAIWTDVSANNLSLEHDGIIISDKFTYWLGSKDETKRFLQKLWNDISPRLKRYWNYVKKLGMDCQGKLFDKNLNPIYEDGSIRKESISVKLFHECFNEYEKENNENN